MWASNRLAALRVWDPPKNNATRPLPLPRLGAEENHPNPSGGARVRHTSADDKRVAHARTRPQSAAKHPSRRVRCRHTAVSYRLPSSPSSSSSPPPFLYPRDHVSSTHVRPVAVAAVAVITVAAGMMTIL